MPKFKDVLRDKALTIHPDHTLDELCSMKASPRRNNALFKIMLHGGEFLGPYWISVYWPMGSDLLRRILSQRINRKKISG